MKKTKKILSILSWATHGAYVLVCTMAILLMKFPIPELPGWLNDVRVLFLMLSLGFSLLFSIFFPFALLGLGFNISLLIAQIADKAEKRASRIILQCARTVLSLAVSGVLWYYVVAVFVWTTGGA